MTGKEKCTILKNIRKDIAERNNIPFEVKECTHTGECKGTCPRCESEMRYLDQEIKKKRTLGKQVLLAGISAAMVTAAAGCEAVETVVDFAKDLAYNKIHKDYPEVEGMIEQQIMGDVGYIQVDGEIEPYTEEEIWMGEVEAYEYICETDGCIDE